MLILKKGFWTTVLAVLWVFFAECYFAFIFLMIYFAIYSATEYQPLNTGVPVLLVKGFLILAASVYNFKKIIAAYKANDFVAVFAFLGITIVYDICIAFLGGGGR
jgi:hypothetical protein